VIIDCHVHAMALVPPRGEISSTLMRRLSSRFLRWKFGDPGDDAAAERAFERSLLDTVNGAEGIDAAVVLAFDAVYGEDGVRDAARTHMYVSNDYVASLAKGSPRALFGASVHPFRRDAVRELERCIAQGAVLLKWLPMTQGFSPADPRCFPMYEVLAHHGVPLLSHTGREKALPTNDDGLATPALLETALRMGVTVIAAHCGARSRRRDTDYIDVWLRMAREHERLYGDTSGLSLPNRWHAYRTLLEHEDARAKLVHGSDWPIPPVPPLPQIGARRTMELARIENWIARDAAIKRALGLGDDYFGRFGALAALGA
jgi:hypothetical protein